MKSAFLFVGLLVASMLISPAQAQTSEPIPAWDHQISGVSRFIVLADFGNAAVLDLETGLVWERTHSGSFSDAASAVANCLNRNVGNRLGWRLPSIFELMTLVDPSTLSGPKLPAGHPFFVSTKPRRYWSATQDNSTGYRWTLTMLTGAAESFDTANVAYTWCVRAPSAENQT